MSAADRLNAALTSDSLGAAYGRELLMFVWFLGLGSMTVTLIELVNPRFAFGLESLLTAPSTGTIIWGTAVVLLPLKVWITGDFRRDFSLSILLKTSIVFVLLVVVAVFGSQVLVNTPDLMEGGHIAF